MTEDAKLPFPDGPPRSQAPFLEPAEVSAHFLSVAGRLDDAMPAARVRVGPDCEVFDDSNRSGFDTSGFPFYRWAHRFQRDQLRDGQIWRAQARTEYLQPLHAGDPEELEVGWTAEIFSRGSSSTFMERGSVRHPVADIEGARLAAWVEAALDAASAALDRRREPAGD